jgi:hypothetical protein
VSTIIIINGEIFANSSFIVWNGCQNDFKTYQKWYSVGSKEVLLLFGADRNPRWLPYHMIGWYILDFSRKVTCQVTIIVKKQIPLDERVLSFLLIPRSLPYSLIYWDINPQNNCMSIDQTFRNWSLGDVCQNSEASKAYNLLYFWGELRIPCESCPP